MIGSSLQISEGICIIIIIINMIIVTQVFIIVNIINFSPSVKKKGQLPYVAWTNRQMDRQMDGWRDGRTDGPIDGLINQLTDRPTTRLIELHARD